MNILFLGSFIKDGYAERISSLSAAGNQFQYNLYTILRQSHSVRALCYIPLYTNGVINEIKDDLENEDIEVFLPKDNGIKKELIAFRKKLSSLSSWADCIITYNVQYPWFHMKHNKRKILVLADYTPVNEEKGIKKIYSYLMKKAIRRYDKVDLLSEKSKRLLKKKQEYQIIHGCIKWDNFKNFDVSDTSEEIIIAYSGVLNKVTGVDLLIRAFNRYKNPNCRLILCGQGKELETMINNYMEKDYRIVYKGYVTKYEYFQILKRANILINPRNMQLSQNKYNFPSKILEYLAAGRVIISTEFSGYEEFKDYIEFCDSTEEELSKTIEKTVKELPCKNNIAFEKNRKYAKKFIWENRAEDFV